MRFEQPVAITAIAQLIGARILGNDKGHATGINEIHKVEPGDLVFVDHAKYYLSCINSAATFIIIDKEMDFPYGKALLIAAQPFEAYQKIVNHFRPFEPSMKMISDSSKIGLGTQILPGVYIGNHVEIGRDCTIYPNVTIMDHCIIGDNVIIQSATVIGSDAFYYNKKSDREIHYKKMTSCGRVVIGNWVEIGAGCTIDRGVTGDTYIGDGSKLDNIVHIGHDVVLGRNCLLASQVGIAGATTLEDNVILWGQVGVNKTITIGKGAMVGGQGGVVGSLEGGKNYWGTPAIEAREKMKESIWMKRIPDLWEKVFGKEKPKKD